MAGFKNAPSNLAYQLWWLVGRLKYTYEIISVLILINFHSNKKLDIVTAHSGCRNGMCMSHNDYGTRNLYAIK